MGCGPSTPAQQPDESPAFEEEILVPPLRLLFDLPEPRSTPEPEPESKAVVDDIRTVRLPSEPAPCDSGATPAPVPFDHEHADDFAESPLTTGGIEAETDSLAVATCNAASDNRAANIAAAWARAAPLRHVYRHGLLCTSPRLRSLLAGVPAGYVSGWKVLYLQSDAGLVDNCVVLARFEVPIHPHVRMYFSEDEHRNRIDLLADSARWTDACASTKFAVSTALLTDARIIGATEAEVHRATQAYTQGKVRMVSQFLVHNPVLGATKFYEVGEVHTEEAAGMAGRNGCVQGIHMYRHASAALTHALLACKEETRYLQVMSAEPLDIADTVDAWQSWPPKVAATCRETQLRGLEMRSRACTDQELADGFAFWDTPPSTVWQEV